MQLEEEPVFVKVWLRKTVTPKFAKSWWNLYNLEVQKGGHEAACIFAGIAMEEAAQKGTCMINPEYNSPFHGQSDVLLAQKRGKRRFLKSKYKKEYLALAERVLVVVKELGLKRDVDYSVN